MKEEFYAYSREGKPPEEWQRLEDHLIKVAEMARGFTVHTSIHERKRGGKLGDTFWGYAR